MLKEKDCWTLNTFALQGPYPAQFHRYTYFNKKKDIKNKIAFIIILKIFRIFKGMIDGDTITRFKFILFFRKFAYLVTLPDPNITNGA